MCFFSTRRRRVRSSSFVVFVSVRTALVIEDDGDDGGHSDDDGGHSDADGHGGDDGRDFDDHHVN